MQHHLDSKVILSEDSEYKSLYPWFLREVGEKAPKHQSPQIPWEWTLYFTLSKIRVQSSFQLGGLYETDEDKAAPQVKERSVIRAKLLPYDVRDSRLQSSTRYSMFGTNRDIAEFELVIYEAEDGKPEKCSAWGSVSYTTEVDFRDITCDDAVAFYLTVTKDRFSRIIRMIAMKSINGGTLGISDVDGFYSDWSPGVSTDDIKVLTRNEKDHPVEIPESCSILPPRLGKIGEFELILIDELEFQLPQESSCADDIEDEESLQPVLPQIDAPKTRPTIDAKTLGVLNSLRIAAWIIVALLFIILIK